MSELSFPNDLSSQENLRNYISEVYKSTLSYETIDIIDAYGNNPTGFQQKINKFGDEKPHTFVIKNGSLNLSGDLTGWIKW